MLNLPSSQYALAFLAIIVPVYLFSNYVQKRLYKIPGPLLRSISTLPRMYSVYRGKSHEDDIALHNKYGPIVRLAPNILSISDPAAINVLYGIGTKFIKSPFYNLARTHDEEGLIPDPFILTDKALHTRMKKNAANAYSLNGLVKMETWIEPITTRLFNILDEAADSTNPVDMALMMRNYAMDAVFALTFGDDMDYLRKGDVDGFLNVLHVATQYMAIFGQIAWIHPLLLGNPLVARLLFGNARPEAGLVLIAQTQIADRTNTASTSGPLTFLQQLLLNQKHNPKASTDREIMTHAFGNISAGSDTTSTAMRAILFNILKHPDVYERLCKEVRGNLSLPVTWAQAKDLPYLSAVIKEGIRIHPSVGMILARIVPAEGATICNKFIEPGVEVGISPWVLQHDPSVFPDPEAFRPERWLDSYSSEEQLKLMNRSFLAFGSGAHTCSGRWISTMEIQKLIPSLLLRYELSLADGGVGYKFENQWFTQQRGLNVLIKRRDGVA